MGKYERDKGARGERMWRDVCRAEGYDAKRGCQLYQRGDEIANFLSRLCGGEHAVSRMGAGSDGEIDE